MPKLPQAAPTIQYSRYRHYNSTIANHFVGWSVNWRTVVIKSEIFLIVSLMMMISNIFRVTSGSINKRYTDQVVNITTPEIESAHSRILQLPERISYMFPYQYYIRYSLCLLYQNWIVFKVSRNSGSSSVGFVRISKCNLDSWRHIANIGGTDMLEMSKYHLQR